MRLRVSHETSMKEAVVMCWCAHVILASGPNCDLKPSLTHGRPCGEMTSTRLTVIMLSLHAHAGRASQYSLCYLRAEVRVRVAPMREMLASSPVTGLGYSGEALNVDPYEPTPVELLV